MNPATKPFTIRRLGSGDLAAMRALNALFGEVFNEPRTYAAKPPDDDYLRHLLAREHIIVLVAERDGAVVGGLSAYALDKTEQAHAEIYLYDLGVLESHRRCGVATALIEALKPIASTYGAWVIFVQADYGDDPAIALYNKLGVREKVLHFDIAVGGDP